MPIPHAPNILQVGHQILRKRIHVRIEHVAPSRCREEFLIRQKKNDQIKHEAKERGGELQIPNLACSPREDVPEGTHAWAHARPREHNIEQKWPANLFLLYQWVMHAMACNRLSEIWLACY